jgi:hypothetical protein
VGAGLIFPTGAGSTSTAAGISSRRVGLGVSIATQSTGRTIVPRQKQAAPGAPNRYLRSPAISANQYATSLQPFVDLGLALEALDLTNFGAGIVSFDLPLVLGDAVVFEFDSGFAHAAVMAAFGRRSYGLPRPTVMRPTGADMTAHVPESVSAGFLDLTVIRDALPPRDPDDDQEDEDDEDDEGDEDDEDDEAHCSQPA